MSSGAQPPLDLVIYITPNCPLCDEAIAAVTHESRHFRVNIRVVDITADDGLHAEYMLEVPVIAIDGDRFCIGVPPPRSLEAWLRNHAPPRRSFLSFRSFFFKSP